MPQRLSLALLLSPLLLGAAGSTQLPIIHGEEASTDEYPSAGQLIMGATIDASAFGGDPNQEVLAPSCTATLVAPDVVLTAAHCVDTYGLTFGILEARDVRLYISFEEDLTWMSDEEHGGNPPLPDDAIGDVGFVAHEGFDIESLNSEVSGPGEYDDIALVFLEQPITDRPHAWLPTEEEDAQLTEGMEVDIIGYGQQTQTNGPFDPPPPGTVNVRIWGTSFIGELASHEMLIGGDEDTTRKCHGDSGGPSYARVATDLSDDVRVVGVTSHAYDERDCAFGGVDTRVGAHLDWIEDQMLAACEDGVRVDCDEPGILRPPGEDDGDGDGNACDGCATAGAEAPQWAWVALIGAGLALRRRRQA